MCPDTSLTCWEKAHNLYIPNHLFSMKEGTLYNSSTIDLAIVSKVNRKSKLVSRKREALFGLVYKNYPSQKLDDGSKKNKCQITVKRWIVQIFRKLLHQCQPL